MKKLLLACMLALGMGVSAQTNVANYTFAKSTGATYTPITGGTVFISGPYDSQVSTAITMGGTFTYGGVGQTTCFINANGAITFGASSSSSSLLSTLGSTTGAIAAFGQDGASSTAPGATPEIRYEDLGTEFVVQFTDHANYYNRSTERLNFQIRLTYATGAINIVYGNNTNPGTTSTSQTEVQVGIRGNSTNFATNVNNLMIGNVPAGTTCDWSDAVTGNSNSSTLLFSGTTNVNVKIPAGLTFTWMPGTQLPVRTFAATTAITSDGATLSWTAPASATGYNIQYRVPGTCTWTNWSGNPVSTNSVVLTGLAENTNYQVRVQALNGSQASVYSHIPNTAGTGNGYTATGTFKTPLNCPTVVTALTSSAITTTSATIGWTAPTSAPASGYEYYFSTSSTAPTAATVATGSTAAGVVSANLTPLAPGTTYYYWVRTNCNGTDKGSWVGSSNFTTLCVPVSVPYSQNFDTTATGTSTNNNAPDCWKYLEPAGWPGYGYVYSSANFSAPNSYYIYSTNTTGGGMLVSPTTTDLMNGLNRVRFMASAGGANYNMEVGTLSDPNDPSTFTIIGAPINLGPTSSAWNEYVVYIPAGTDQVLAFRHPGQTTTATSIRIDDIFVELSPSCVEPTALTLAGTTFTSASVTWTAPATAPAGGYDVFYSTVNAAPTGATVLDATNSVTSTTVSASIGGLTPDTIYYVWVRSHCTATDQSSWTGPLSIFTAYCLPSGGTYYIDELTSTGAATNINYTGTATVAGGYRNLTATDKISSYAGSTTPITISGSGTTNTYGYAVWIDWNNNLLFETSERMFVTSAYANTATGSIMVPTGTAVGNYRARVQMNYNSTAPSAPCVTAINGEHIDFTFEVTAPPACLEPTGLMSAGVTTNSASLSWTAPATAPASGYEVYYSGINTAPTAATVLDATNSVTSTTLSATIPGLTQNTTYYIWVRSDCGTSQSAWTGPLTVYTGYCSPAPSSVDGQGITNVTFGSGTNVVNNTTVAEPGNYGDYSAMVGDIQAAVASQVSISYATGYTYGTKIWIDLNNDLIFDDATELLYTGLSASTDPTTLSAFITIPLATLPGNYRMRIGGTDNNAGPSSACYTGTYGTFEDYTVNVTSAPSCLPPTGLTVDGTSVTSTGVSITFTASTTAPANGYSVYFSTVNTAPTATTVLTPTNSVNASASPATIAGLAPATQYYAWIRTNCSTSDQSSWAGPVTFTTACVAVATFAENFDTTTTTGSVLPTCWSKIATGSSANTYVQASTAMSGPNALYVYSNSATDIVYVKLPEVSTLNTGLYSLKFNGRANFTAGGIMEIGYMTNAADPATFVVLGTYTASSTTVIDTFITNITGVPAGVTTLAFRHTGVPANSILIDNVQYDLTSVLSTSDVKTEEVAVTVYPNPFTDVVNISNVKDLKSVSVVDMSGRMVKTIANPGRQINLSELKAGLYILKLDYKDGTVQTVKAIKK